MDAVGLRVVGSPLAQLEAARELLADRRREARDLLRRRAASRARTGRAAPRGGSRSPTRARCRRSGAGRAAASAGAASRRRGSRRALPRRARPPRARGARSRLGSASGVQQPDAGALLRAGLGEHQLAAAGEARAGTPASSGPARPGARYRSRPALIRCTISTSSPSSVGKSRRFARRRAPVEALALERGERRVERLQGRDVGRPGLLDRERASRRGRAGGATPPSLAAPATYPPAVDPLRVTVRRGRVVEAVHRVHVPTAEGLGTGTTCAASSARPRSRSRPCRSLDAYDDLDDDELAIACASHQAEPAQLAAVASCSRARARPPTTSRTGRRPGRPEGKVGHNCSGKHAGMLAALPRERLAAPRLPRPGHPLQQRIAELLGGVGETAVDGCGVPTFTAALPEAAACSRRRRRASGDAMRARPELIGGAGAADTALMRAARAGSPRAAPKASSAPSRPTAVGSALKVEDGASRAAGARARPGAGPRRVPHRSRSQLARGDRRLRP